MKKSNSNFAMLRGVLLATSMLVLPGVGSTAWAQSKAADQGAEGSNASNDSDIVVTGFRSSLSKALGTKRDSIAAIDSIQAEDVGKFPDSNLAESMQRVPGVTLSRGDGNEGRTITVRGLGPQFTTVRINGMQGASMVSATDIQGGVGSGSGRSFDFITFPTEIFSNLTVRKTISADIEEGSLGATVDLRAPRPLEQREDFVFTGTVRGIYNTVSEKIDPRLSAVVGKKFADGTFGILGSLAYSKRNVQEFGYSAVNILPSYVAGAAQPGGGPNGGVVFPYCTPVGYVYNGVAVNSPAIGTTVNGNPVGADANNCATGVPRTSTVAAYDYVMNHKGISGKPGGGIFLPRLPRPVSSKQNQERVAGTLSMQWQPDDNTDVSIDGLYSRLKVHRYDAYFDARSMGRNLSNSGQPMMSVKDISVDDNGSLLYGLWDGVDLRSEMQDEVYTSTFRQVNLNFDHRFSDSFRVYGFAGVSDSKLYSDKLQVAMDINNTNNFSIDFRDGGVTPIMKYGIDPTDASLFTYGPADPDGSQHGAISATQRTNKVVNKSFDLNAEWTVAQGFSFLVGGQYRESNFTIRERGLAPGFNTPRALPAGVTPASFSQSIPGVGSNTDGRMSDFVAIDPAKFRSAVDFDNFKYCTALECGSGSFGNVFEKYKSGFGMVKFDTSDILPVTIRGDAGVRYVKTEMATNGYVPVKAPVGSAYANIGVITGVDRSYDDWLPSANLAIDITPKLVARLAAAKVMTRPNYPQLVPSGSFNAAVRTASLGNANLDPIRASTYDAALEWYFAPGSLLSVAYFHKNIGTYVQTVQTLVPFNTLGLPESLLAGTGVTPTDLFTFTSSVNTPGGKLDGYEVNLQLPFRFLPGVLKNFGLLANYTHVKSNINYVLQSAGGVVTLSRTAPLAGLSPDTASGTLYYEDSKFSIRSTVNYRSAFATNIPSGSPDSDAYGVRKSIFVDASASYAVTDQFKVILEAQNIFDRHNSLYFDTTRQDTLYDSSSGRTFAVAINFKY